MTSNIETMERAIIGALLTKQDTAVLLDELGDLTRGHFYSLQCGAVFEVIQHMVTENRVQVDPTTVDARIRETPDFPIRGIDFPFLLLCVELRPYFALVPTYAQQVISESVKRNLATAGGDITAAAREGMDAEELLDFARRRVEESGGVPSAPLTASSDTVAATLAMMRNPVRGTPTPWIDVNDLIGGLVGGRLYVIGARPSVGKSVVALQMALALAKAGYVSFSSLEMGAPEINQRTFAHDLRINLKKIMQGPLTADEWGRLERYSAEGHHSTLIINDDSNATFSNIRKHARATARKGKLSGVIVDYLQLMNAERGDRRPRHEIVAEWSRNLKNLARELDVPVIALSQLNRASTEGADPMPKISQLRESGAVEQDADVVMLLHREFPGPNENELKMLIAKNRQGRAGLVELDFYGHYSEARTQ